MASQRRQRMWVCSHGSVGKKDHSCSQELCLGLGPRSTVFSREHLAVTHLRTRKKIHRQRLRGRVVVGNRKRNEEMKGQSLLGKKVLKADEQNEI